MIMRKEKRPVCPQCFRPLKTCVCKFVVAIPHKIPVVILQNPEEASHAKNTGRLLNLCLENSYLIQGESFDENKLDEMLNKKTARHFVDLLLYPDQTDYNSLNIAPPPPLDWARFERIEPPHGNLENHLPRLWVIDATWRKSRKMLYLNEFLQKMPLFPIDIQTLGNYFIRKASNENQLSTFEATCYALQTLESHLFDAPNTQSEIDSAAYARAFSAFDSFVQEQARYFKF